MRGEGQGGRPRRNNAAESRQSSAERGMTRPAARLDAPARRAVSAGFLRSSPCLSTELFARVLADKPVVDSDHAAHTVFVSVNRS